MAGLDATESDDDASEMTADAARPAAGPRLVSGKLVVIGMFAFGLFLTGLLFAYWDLHTRPFRPLQEVTPYERIELHVEHRVPERPAEFWSSIRTPAEWEAFSSQQDGRSS